MCLWNQIKGLWQSSLLLYMCRDSHALLSWGLVSYHKHLSLCMYNNRLLWHTSTKMIHWVWSLWYRYRKWIDFMRCIWKQTHSGDARLLGAQDDSLILVSLTPNWLPQINYFFWDVYETKLTMGVPDYTSTKMIHWVWSLWYWHQIGYHNELIL